MLVGLVSRDRAPRAGFFPEDIGSRSCVSSIWQYNAVESRLMPPQQATAGLFPLPDGPLPCGAEFAVTSLFTPDATFRVADERSEEFSVATSELTHGSLRPPLRLVMVQKSPEREIARPVATRLAYLPPMTGPSAKIPGALLRSGSKSYEETPDLIFPTAASAAI
ncbi:MAG: hypothetical protein ACKOD5_14340, partial [Chthoniobacterales bacterium]